jgi:CheY-like chemotaxis protein
VSKNPAKNTTILYMDDDIDDLLLLQEAVQTVNASYRVLPATNGLDGLEKLSRMNQERNLPCLIVMDINMPQLCGRETFLQLKADPVLSTIPIVIFSTSSSAKDKAFFEAPNVVYLTKPINFAHLTEVARKLINFCNSQAA